MFYRRRTSSRQSILQGLPEAVALVRGEDVGSCCTGCCRCRRPSIIEKVRETRGRSQARSQRVRLHHRLNSKLAQVAASTRCSGPRSAYRHRQGPRGRRACARRLKTADEAAMLRTASALRDRFAESTQSEPHRFTVTAARAGDLAVTPGRDLQPRALRGGGAH